MAGLTGDPCRPTARSPAHGSECVRCSWTTPAGAGWSTMPSPSCNKERESERGVRKPRRICERTHALQNRSPLKNPLPAQVQEVPAASHVSLGAQGRLFVFSLHCRLYGNVKSRAWKQIRSWTSRKSVALKDGLLPDRWGRGGLGK